MKSYLRSTVLFLLMTLAVGAGSAGNDRLARVDPGGDPWSRLDPTDLQLRSAAALIVDERGHRIYGKNTGAVKPIASITKLMTAMVVLDAGVGLDTPITVSRADRDQLRQTGSRLRLDQATLTRRDMLLIALMSSENRAAAALGRTTFPAGTPMFVRTMNRKASELGMTGSRFAEPTGLDAANVSTAEDLITLLRAAAQYPLIRRATTLAELEVHPYPNSGPLAYRNTNRLIKNEAWSIELSKTGYINEAGRCLVMRARIAGRPLYIVLLDSFGKLTPVGDSNRLRKWIKAGLQTDRHG